MKNQEQVPNLQLGPDEPQVQPLGIGTRTWCYGDDAAVSDRRKAFETAMSAGVTLFDTAEVYAIGKSERLLGSFIQKSGGAAVVMTKYAPFPWRFGRKSIVNALRRSLQRLGMEQVHLYMIHWPYTLMSIETMAEGLADAVEAGLAKSVGVSNFNPKQMQRAHDLLAERGIPLASNQVAFSLLKRDPEANGLIDLCRQLNVTLVAYAPLATGVLTGKYTPEQPPTGFLGLRRGKSYISRLQSLIGLMQDIGEAHGNKTPGQVALNWTIAKGAIPIPGAKNARQAKENIGALGWSLTEAEVASLDAAAQID
jgi:aryl-alcohol dehydrogenase-like predicted oxidoreductase